MASEGYGHARTGVGAVRAAARGGLRNQRKAPRNLAGVAELAPAPLEELGDRNPGERLELGQQDAADGRRRLGRGAVGPAGRLGDDRVDQTVLQEVGGRQATGSRRSPPD